MKLVLLTLNLIMKYLFESLEEWGKYFEYLNGF